VKRDLPRFVTPKSVAGRDRFYWTLPTYYRKLGCTLHLEHDTALGADYEAACKTAATLNGLFDDWDAKRLGMPPEPATKDKPGTVDWLFRTYRSSNDWRERVSARTAPDHERTIRLLCDLKGKSGTRVGDRLISTVKPDLADRLYEMVRDTPTRKGPKSKGKKTRPRTAEKVVAIARHAWKVVRRLHPLLFDKDVPNPWEGVAMTRRTKATKPAATRDEVYTFAWGAVAADMPELGAAAVICFEWLQRPENVLAGYVRWSDYRNPTWPRAIRIEHHKTGEMVLHPLEEAAGEVPTSFYAEAEEILAKVPKRGLAMVLRAGRGGKDRPWTPMTSHHVVRDLRERLALPDTFTLDACRHGGMTELEEAELTDGQGRALSAHRSKAYDGYAKRTEKRALAATRKRHAHRIALMGEGIESVTEAVAPAEKRRAASPRANREDF
jgi:hypothetical protein